MTSAVVSDDPVRTSTVPLKQSNHTDCMLLNCFLIPIYPLVLFDVQLIEGVIILYGFMGFFGDELVYIRDLVDRIDILFR